MTKTRYLVRLVVILAFVIKLEAVTVNPLCPTNKVAPHKRNARGERRIPRTIGAFYNLLVPDSQQTNNPGQLQEESQTESPDCGNNIEDHHENNLSSASPGTSRRVYFPAQGNDRFFHMFFNQLFGSKPNTNTTVHTMEARPPSGGYFANNSYNPQHHLHHHASEHVRPVIEHGVDHVEYPYHWTGLVGALNPEVIGATQVKVAETDTTGQRQSLYPNYAVPAQNQQRPRYFGGRGVFDSFIDLIL